MIKIRKSGKALIKLIGVDTPAAKQLEKQVEDLDECRNTIGDDTLTRIKKVCDGTNDIYGCSLGVKYLELYI